MNNPRWIRCYDDDGRYTVVFTKKRIGGEILYINMDHWGHVHSNLSSTSIDLPRYSHLGKKVTFDKLPEECQNTVRRFYYELWELEGKLKDFFRRTNTPTQVPIHNRFADIEGYENIVEYIMENHDDFDNAELREILSHGLQW